ncbi:MAG: hypothetical protein P4L98_22530, partial [Ancalomicrobiaceae bacterium]|nr:hypothetical protein [Ancalomicrobiaceae bacterium]
MSSRLGAGPIRSYFRILASGAFEHCAYARVHLGSRVWAPIALAHYLLVGEARGCRPTPFFDPDHARAAHTGPAGTSVFACFLAAGA